MFCFSFFYTKILYKFLDKNLYKILVFCLKIA